MCSSEVSEVIFQVFNCSASGKLYFRCDQSIAVCVCNLYVLLRACELSCTHRVRNKIGCKSRDFRHLYQFDFGVVTARLARLARLGVYALTSPLNPSITLGIHTKARLARLFLLTPMYVCVCVRTRRRDISAYRSGMKITSLISLTSPAQKPATEGI